MGRARKKSASAARAEAWTKIQEEHEALSGQRSELAELRQRVAAGAEGLEVEEGQDAEGLLAELQEEIAAKVKSATEAADAFSVNLVNFINDAGAAVGEEPPELLAALRMKTDEDIELAEEYVREGGDYRRAIDILERSKEIDPEYARRDEILVGFQDMRYVSDGRFAQIEKGMSEAAVTDILGRVYHRNIREYDEQDVIAWFYPKDPEEAGPNAAAAVFFQERGGALKVYRTQWEIKTDG